MKITLLLLIIATSFYSWSQDSIQISPNGYFDKIFTRYGDSIHLKDIFIDERFKETSSPKAILLCSSGYFDLYFESGSGMEGNSLLEIARRNVLCQVFSDISQFIQTPNPNVKVNILVKNINPLLPGYNSITYPFPAALNSTLGLATGYYVLPSGNQSLSGIIDNEIWKTINSGIDSYTNVASPLIINNSSNQGSNLYHGMVAFNFDNSSVNYNLNLSLINPAGLYDFYSVVLHEVTHALGFASLIDVNGNSKFGVNYKYFSRYDSFLKTQSNQPLITNAGNCSLYNMSFNPALNTNIMTPSPFNCTSNIKFSGTVNQITHTPTVFSNASSLSHLEDICHQPNSYLNNEYYSMSNSIGSGATYMKRFLKPEERKVLCDIGYKVNNSFGNTSNLSYINYGGNICSGLEVVGVNDGIITNGPNIGVYQYITSVGSSALLINNICANDYNTYSFECLEIIIGNGTLSNTSGTSFNFTAQTQGLVLLRYIPVSANGAKGNITFVYIYVTPIQCTPSSCNLLSNAGFENTTTCGQIIISGLNNGMFAVSDCWNRFVNSPRFFQRNCVNTSPPFINFQSIYNLPSNSFNTTQYDSWNGSPNNTFLNLRSWYVTPGGHCNDAIQSLLTSPLIPGNTYLISFYARLANNTLPANSDGKITIGASSSFLAPILGSQNSLPSSIIPFGNQLTIVNNNSWQYITTSFTYNGNINLNNFIILNSTNFTPNVNYLTTSIFIDDIKIEEVNPSLALTIPNILCVNQTISNLSIYAPIQGGVFSGNGVSFNSSNGIYSFNPNFAGVGNHQITYTYTNNFGCEKIIYDQIQVVNSTINASITASSTSVCNGQTISLVGNSLGANSYTWNPGNINGSVIFPLITSSTNYTLTTTNADGCVANSTISITASEQPIIQITPSSSICSGQQVNLVATGAQNFNWSPNTNLSTVNGASVFASPTTTTVYTVTGSNVPGCTSNASTTINVTNCTDCSAVSTISGNLSNAAYSNTSIKILNNITISGNVSFTNVNVKIMPGVIITVLPTATLTIIGSHLYGCQNMWGGIKIQSGGKINIQPYIIGSVIQKTTLFEDATIALDFSPISSSQTTAVLQVNNATFNKNETSINIQGYNFDNVSTIFNVINSLFTCRTIYNTSLGTWPLTSSIKVLNANTNLFLEPYINTITYPLTMMKAPLNSTFSEKGINLLNVGTTTNTSPQVYTSIVFGSTTQSEFNLFDNLKIGIYAENSNIKVINTTFQFPTTISNTLFYSISLPNPGTGIFANATSGGVYKVDVAGTSTQPNKFYGLSRALHTIKYREIQFIYNTVRSNRQNLVPMGGYNNGRFGIYMLVEKYNNVIITNNTIYNIDKGVFLNVSVSGQSPSVKILSNIFHNNLNTTYGARNSDAVLLENVLSTPNTGGLVWVNSNTIAGNARAITLNNWNRTTIQIKNNGIALFGHSSSSVVSHGIALNSCSQGTLATQIYENNISGFSINHPNFKGIALTSTVGNELRCNAVNNTYSGIYFNGNCNPTKTYNNSMENHRYGFVLDNGGVIGQQGTSTTPADNRWLGTWDPTGTPSGKFKNACFNMSSTEFSKMFVRSGVTYSPNGSTSNLLGNWTYTTSLSPITLFTVTSPSVYSACSTIATPPILNLYPVETASALEATTVTSSSTLYVDRQAVIINQSYRALDADSTLMQNSTNLATFYNATTTTNTAKLLEVEKAIAVNDSSLAIFKNASISPQNSLEDSYKLFYDALLNYQNNDFSATDSLILHDIATGCPTLQGGVVYQSAALNNLVYSLAEVFDPICPEYLDKSMQLGLLERSESSEFVIYPVPNDGSFDIIGELKKDMHLTIINMDGKMVYSQTINEESSVLSIQSSLSNGTYTVLLTDVNEMQLTRIKIVILK